MKPGLGTQLRHLIELLDGAVEQAYVDAGLDYRPRYTPVMRVLAEQASATVGELAALAGLTQPAATQTVALMVKKGLLTVAAGGADGRQRVVRLSATGETLLPRLRVCWQATKSAADSLDAELAFPLSACLGQAIAVLETRSFGARIRDANLQRLRDGGPQLDTAPAQARPHLDDQPE
ncbi:MarR family winged helix-turn-helix transcriptional regulator [Janthinobacterium kumbetense]|uniref:MarR family transcriptional regulator n=1 Tax=Janthinobacterium kumbetense TaxID=2950280 RepID=A0ABT0WLT3_9BURK|nr:helix-turn-helix domain-containing protein [Janthinobacterium kumbetense]MCM2565026.1 MarR family transcriptional regulator [Janthinobacterium kumbetense]